MRLGQAANCETIDPAKLPRAAVTGLYVHVPFCFHKCHYCDFYSITRQSNDRMQRYVDLVLEEAQLWLKSPVEFQPTTIFFGGGTPTLLPQDQMARLIDGLRRRIDLSLVNEWTIEANPATVDSAYCRMLRDSGVDRISFGAQSFDVSQLRLLERHHDPEQVVRSVEIAREAGFARLNLDLIYAIPGQSIQSWNTSLDAAMALQPEHISCYALTYEPNTPMTVRKRLGQFLPCEDSLEIEMMRHARARLSAAGYNPYEISNYARAGEACRHNLLYWDGGNYIGLGPSAASHVEGHRWKNRPHLGEWEQAIESGNLPAAEAETLSLFRRAGEWIMLRLRLSDGISFDEYRRRTGEDVRRLHEQTLQRLAKLGLIDITDHGFCLSEAGLPVADSVAAQFL